MVFLQLKAGKKSKAKAKQTVVLTTPQITFAAVAAPNPPSSPTDWSDVDQLIKDIDAISVGLQPVLTLGGQLQQFLAKVKEQMGIPAELHAKLSQLINGAKFLHDLLQFLQTFPDLSIFLPALTSSLADELKAAGELDTAMNQLVQSATALSNSVQVCMVLYILI